MGCYRNSKEIVRKKASNFRNLSVFIWFVQLILTISFALT
jgi:hypothetical protein